MLMVGIQPNSAEAYGWVEDNVQTENHNWTNGVFWGRKQDMEDVVDGMTADGLKDEVDFLVFFGLL